MTALRVPCTPYREPDETRVAVRELWAHLGATMRVLRETGGKSLRQVELESGVGRGTLSQYETGKARPNRFVVEWYDEAFGGDGLLSAVFAEARGAHGPSAGAQPVSAPVPGDAVTVVDGDPPRGSLVACGTSVAVSWSLRNSGTVPWRDRRVARLGARAGATLLTSHASDPVPDCEPGAVVRVAVPVGVPAVAATYAAYWQIVDAGGRSLLPFDLALSVELVARHL